MPAGISPQDRSDGENPAPEEDLPVFETTVRAKRPRETIPITVVGQQEIKRTHSRNVADVVNRLPGITTDGPSNQRSRNQFASIRGLPPEYTLVLVDGGRTATEGRGKVNLSTIPVGSVERIEVIRGPLAVLYGTEAIGGVVNVVTRSENPVSFFSLENGYGAFDTWHAGAAGQLANQRGSLRLDLRYEDSQGWTDTWDLDRTLRKTFAHSDSRPTKELFVRGGGTIRLPRNNTLTLDLRGTYKTLDQTREISLYTSEGTRSGKEERYLSNASLLWIGRPTSSLQLESSLSFDGFFKQRRELEHLFLRSAGREIGSSLATNELESFDWLVGWQSRAIWTPDEETEFITLLDVHRQARSSDDSRRVQTYDEEGYLVGDANYREPDRIYDKAHLVIAGAIQLKRHLGRYLTITGGGRLEWNQTWGGFFSPAGALAVRLARGLSLSYALGRGYKMPSFESLSYSTAVFDSLNGVWRSGNPELRPESSLSQEIGLTLAPRSLWAGSPLRLSAGVTFFFIDFHDRILTATELDWNNSGFPFEREINVGQVTSLGAEARVGLELPHDLYLVVNASYLRARNDDLGMRLDNTPDWTVNVMAGGELPRLQTQLSLSFRYLTERPRISADGIIRDDSPVEELILLDADIRQPITDQLALWVELRNLLNREWDKDNDGDSDQPPFHAFFGLSLLL
jgi:outer membrane cobalamin receptor